VDVSPHRLGQARLWQHAEPGFAFLSVWTERVPGRGEDADPLVVLNRRSGRGLLAVFDGVGGAGRATAGRTPAGVERTQAWIASRRLRGLVEEWFVGGMPSEALAPHVTARLAEGVRVRSRMRGTIHRELPSTLAALDFQVSPDRKVLWEVLWAGDSRCYLAEAEHGLAQLSRDDTEVCDALELLVEDPPMTNMVCTDREFVLNRWRGRAPLPCVLVTATDGFFGYVATPAQFEHVLLDTLGLAHDLRHWAELLAGRVMTYTGDDASIAVAGLGFAGFDDLRRAFHRRADHLRINHDEPLRWAAGLDRSELVAVREESWRRYQPGYERQWRPACLPPSRRTGEAGADAERLHGRKQADECRRRQVPVGLCREGRQ
jgi:serine/threonine protein phosphatase PrpC